MRDKKGRRVGDRRWEEREKKIDGCERRGDGKRRGEERRGEGERS